MSANISESATSLPSLRLPHGQCAAWSGESAALAPPARGGCPPSRARPASHRAAARLTLRSALLCAALCRAAERNHAAPQGVAGGPLGGCGAADRCPGGGQRRQGGAFRLRLGGGSVGPGCSLPLAFSVLLCCICFAAYSPPPVSRCCLPPPTPYPPGHPHPPRVRLAWPTGVAQPCHSRLLRPALHCRTEPLPSATRRKPARRLWWTA